MHREFDWDKHNDQQDRTMMKSSLSPQRASLLEAMQSLRYGWIRNLPVREGEPVLDEGVAIVQNVKMNGRNNPHPLLAAEDYALKHEATALFAQLDALQTGLIEVIEVKDGLPFQLHVHRRHVWPPTVKMTNSKKVPPTRQKLR
ncbi:MAG: hypothetical protein ACE5KM_12430 [Planctomycetaceae bacterium]